jgi:hypothetical protein
MKKVLGQDHYCLIGIL